MVRGIVFPDLNRDLPLKGRFGGPFLLRGLLDVRTFLQRFVARRRRGRLIRIERRD